MGDMAERVGQAAVELVREMLGSEVALNEPHKVLGERGLVLGGVPLGRGELGKVMQVLLWKWFRRTGA